MTWNALFSEDEVWFEADYFAGYAANVFLLDLQDSFKINVFAQLHIRL